MKAVAPSTQRSITAFFARKQPPPPPEHDAPPPQPEEPPAAAVEVHRRVDGTDAGTPQADGAQAAAAVEEPEASAGPTPGGDENAAPAGGLTAYEQERLDRIARNRQVMAQLGLGGGPAFAAAPRTAPRAPPRKRAAPAPPPPRGPLRRSSRRGGGGGAAGGGGAPQAAPPSESESEEEELVYDDSSVRRYVCEVLQGGDGGAAAAHSWRAPPPPAGAAIAGFARLPATLADPALARCYGLDVAPGLVAAGGKDGRCAVFPAAGGAAGGGDAPPLLSARLHKGWVADVHFPSSCTPAAGADELADGAPLRLLSAGNDGVVCLWDLSVVAAGGAPARLAHAAGLHSGGGVFSMHEAAGTVLTAGKDGAVAVLRLGAAGAGFAAEARFDDLHGGGVVKCARWRPGGGAAVFASCGNDHCVRIVDVRAPRGAALCSAAADTAVNVVRWHPRNEHLVLSASNDPAILVHDLRALGAGPLHALAGHARGPRVKGIYQPAWVAAGAAVAAVGPDAGSPLSLYDARTGAAVSRGALDAGGAPVGATFCGGAPSDPLLLAAGRAVLLFAPQWRPPPGG